MRKPIDLTKFAAGQMKSLSISSGFRDPDIWISTGNYLLDYIISGKFRNGGVPMGKLSMFAGESGSGKSFVVSGNIVREAQQKGIIPVIIDTENALDEEWLTRLGIDTDPEKLLRFNVSMISDVGKIISDFVKTYKESYMDLDPSERPQYLFVIDSLGMLLTETDVDQFNKGELKGDMGRKPKQLNALVRNSINLIADCNIGIVCTNHTYASQDMFDPDDKISGGMGAIFASSIVVASKKYKLKEDENGVKGKDVLGVRTTFKIMKTRYGRPFETANAHIRFDSGLDKYSGLLEYFEKIGVVEKVGNKLQYIDKDGNEHKEFRKNFGSDILETIIDEWDYKAHTLLSSHEAESEEELAEEMENFDTTEFDSIIEE